MPRTAKPGMGGASHRELLGFWLVVCLGIRKSNCRTSKESRTWPITCGIGEKFSFIRRSERCFPIWPLPPENGRENTAANPDLVRRMHHTVAGSSWRDSAAVRREQTRWVLQRGSTKNRPCNARMADEEHASRHFSERTRLIPRPRFPSSELAHWRWSYEWAARSRSRKRCRPSTAVLEGGFRGQATATPAAGSARRGVHPKRPVI